MKLEINGHQEGVDSPQWFRVKECPSCHAKSVPFTLVRYGQSSYRKEDQTGTSRQSGGFGAGFHSNRLALRCRCGYEETLPDEPLKKSQPFEPYKIKSKPLKHEEPTETTGQNTINLHYSAHTDALTSMFTARKNGVLGIKWAYSIEDLAEFLNRLPMPEGTPKVTRSMMSRWLESEGLTRPSRPPHTTE